ncbi:MAG: DUF192 domain-containing protein [Candidatus Cybelea sp.]
MLNVIVLAAALATIVVHAPKADLTLETARTEPAREQGLMNRAVLSPHTGMLFVFDRDERVDFWMKDTLVPLDMIFIAGDGTVRRVFSNVAVVAPTLPDDQIPREGAPAKYVIELPAGEASADGIAGGVKLDLRAAPAPQP